ncbi:MAG: RICIN domain-containing protein [Ruminococcus sp.]|nr:RICIN domain-containing protein [Ruminococcus sp.]
MKRKLINILHTATELLLCLSLLLTPADIRTLAESPISAETETLCGEGMIIRSDDDMYTGSAVCGDLVISVSFTDEAGIPEGAMVSLSEITEDMQQYGSYFELSGTVLSQSIDDSTNVSLQYARFFDISFVHDGEMIEPAAAVSVGISYERPELDFEGSEIMTDVIHFAEEETVLIEAESEQDTADNEYTITDRMTFETDSFSAYGILFYNLDGDNIGDMLDGMTFALVHWNGALSDTNVTNINVSAVMAEYKQASRLAARAITIYPTSKMDNVTDDFTHYAVADPDISQWTFTWIEGNDYYITSQVDGVTKYLSIYNDSVTVNGSTGARVELLDEPDEYSVITVQNNGTGNNAGKLRLINKDYRALNLKGKNVANGYQSYGPRTTSTEWTEWFVPAIYTDAVIKDNTAPRPVGEVIYTATKVSVSDTESLRDGSQVVVYSKVWNSD